MWCCNGSFFFFIDVLGGVGGVGVTCVIVFWFSRCIGLGIFGNGGACVGGSSMLLFLSISGRSLSWTRLQVSAFILQRKWRFRSVVRLLSSTNMQYYM